MSRWVLTADDAGFQQQMDCRRIGGQGMVWALGVRAVERILDHCCADDTKFRAGACQWKVLRREIA